ncbi:hypothetical protein RUM44_000233 [Polyplax serrata]|uniref:Uncharacterized protein n=1 Tax=Polyplax serrata TaxID=468196 RepID=A0ABR1B4W7_POLSC
MEHDRKVEPTDSFIQADTAPYLDEKKIFSAADSTENYFVSSIETDDTLKRSSKINRREINSNQLDYYKAWRDYKRKNKAAKRKKKQKKRQIFEIYRDENYCTVDSWTDDEEFNYSDCKSCGVPL